MDLHSCVHIFTYRHIYSVCTKKFTAGKEGRQRIYVTLYGEIIPATLQAPSLNVHRIRRRRWRRKVFLLIYVCKHACMFVMCVCMYVGW